MRILTLALLLGAPPQGQDDSAGQVGELIRQLRSDSADERDAAAIKLRKIGKPAIEELKKAAADSDVDLSSRAKALLEAIAIDANPLLHPQKAAMNRKAPPQFKASFQTSKGEFVVQVTREWAPLGADRFYNLVKSGFYDDCRFFRVIAGFMAQFGIHGDPAVSALWKGAKIDDDPGKQSNTRGRLSFATSGPNTRTTQLFINFGDNSRLDPLGFAPFGEVVEGMDVVDKLNSEYGEGGPRGKGPMQAKIQTEGNKYLKQDFDRLDYIKTAKIIE
jgi:cyclophilin family peptidyl-prolyl cis-trans isomerase